jgi:hypothetical protein
MLGKRLVLILGFLIISISLLSACSEKLSDQESRSKKEARDGPEKPEVRESHTGKTIVPISIPEGEFGGIQGWIDDQTIVYLNSTEQISILYLYDLYSGKTTELFKSDIPIVSVVVSPSRDRLLIHTSPNSYEGIINIIDKKGKILVEKSLLSSELTFEWNLFNEELILISSFDEEWEFNVFLLNIQKNELKESVLTDQPFASWIASDQLIYLNWDLNAPEFFAPVIKQEIINGEKEQLNCSNVFQLDSFKDFLLLITANQNKQEYAVYTLLSDEWKPLKTFTIPHLSRFSDWLIPFYDFQPKKKVFITFQPVTSGEFDTYNQGFQLVQYHIKDKQEDVLFEGMENKPLRFSPNGDFLLYGHQFENLIDLRTKKIISLTK